MTDPIQEVLNGTDPDTVLVRVRHAEGVSLAVRKDYGRPIDYLMYRSKTPISAYQFTAAEMYIAAFASLSPMASNTANTIDHMQRSKVLTPAEVKELRSQRDTGRYIHGSCDAGPSSDPSTRMLASALGLKRVEERLDPVMVTLLRDLLLKEMSLGVIAQRWRWSSETASTMVRYALAKLVAVYQSLDEDFAAVIRADRVAEQDSRL
jgi:hypothetical protein